MVRRLNRSDLIALIVASAFFMEGLDSTIIAPAIPDMAVAFGTSAVSLSAGISAYLVTVAIFVPASSWAADRFGVRNVFSAAICLFTLASILCGLSTTLTQFTAARVLQGVAGAMMSPVGRAAVMRNTEKRDFMRATALMTWPGLSSFIIGPPLGGLITSYASWPWIFFINIPIGLIGLTLVVIYFDNHKVKRPFDVAGFLLNAGALAALMYGLDLVGHSRANWALGGLMMGTGLVIGVFAIRHALRHPHPLISLAPLRIRTFLLGTLVSGMPFRMIIAAGGFLLPMMFQIGFGISALISGLLMLAQAAGDLGIKFRTTMIVRRFGFRRILIVNGCLVALSTLICAAFAPATPVWLMFIVLIFVGAFRSLQFTSLSAISYSDIPMAGIGNATTLFSMIHQISLGLGIAASAIALNVSTALRDVAAPEPQDFRIAFYVMTAFAIFSMLNFLRLDPGSGSAVSQHQAGRSTPK